MNDLSLSVLDIVQNCIAAKAKLISINIADEKEGYRMTVSDDGVGMTQEEQKKALCGGYTTKKDGGGQGLYLLKRRAKSLSLVSRKGEGTTVEAVFSQSETTVGDMPKTVMALLASGTDARIVFEHQRDGKTVRFDTEDMRRYLKDVPIGDPEVLKWTQRCLAQQYEQHEK